MKLLKYLLILIPFLTITSKKSTITHQLANYERVRQAKEFTHKQSQKLFKDKGLTLSKSKIFIRVFKFEGILELWAAHNNKDQYTKIKDYPICAMSGDWGPKRQQGDFQVPEGFYRISNFNPTSKFHLSMQINYPNESDKIRTTNPSDPGNYIMIHGNCVSIGCIAIQDNAIEELYWISLNASRLNKIPVHIFPCRLNAFRYKIKRYLKKDNTKQLYFWNELKKGHDHFQKTKTLPKITTNAKGQYTTQQ